MKWEKVKLGEVCETTSGGTPDRKKDSYFGGDIPWVKSGELSQRLVTHTSENITVEGLKNSSAKLQPPGVVLLALYGATVGKCAILGIEAATNQAVCCIKPSPRLRNDFLLRYLESQIKQIIQLGVGGAQPNISQQIVRNIEIPLPTLDEQKRIAAILDAADALRRTRRKSLARLDELAQSLFLEMFGDPATNPKGWEEKKLVDEIEFLTSGSRGWATYYAESGDTFIRIQNVGKNQLLLDDLTFVNAPNNAEAKRTQTRPGDVLLSITADLGRTAVIPETLPKAYINQHLALIRLKQLNPCFVAQLLSSDYGKRQFASFDKSAVKSGLNFDDIRKFPMILPPIYLQQSFARQIEELDTIKTRARAQLLELDALFASLQERAFSGQL